jgi:hypothetical protein
LLVWGLVRGKQLLEVGIPDLLSLLLNCQRRVFQDFIDELSEELSLQLDQALCLQVLPFLPIEVILLPPRVKVDLNVGRVNTRDGVSALIDLDHERILEGVLLHWVLKS